MKERKYNLCAHCGNLLETVCDGGVAPVCCGRKMELLTPNTVQAGGEKHLPLARVGDGAVEVWVGAAEHPMGQDHRIGWIGLETDRGTRRRYLVPGEAPRARFSLDGETPLAVYAWCNLHGLWKKELN